MATIAVGVGSNAAVQGFNRGLIARDMPSVETEGVVSVFTRDANGEVAPLSVDELAALKRRTDVFEWLGPPASVRAASS